MTAKRAPGRVSTSPKRPPSSGWAPILRTIIEADTDPSSSPTEPPSGCGERSNGARSARPRTPSGFYHLKCADHASLKVLLLLPDPALRSVAKQMLRRHLPGVATLRAAASTDDALAQLRADVFDVVVTSACGADDPTLRRLASFAAAHGDVPIVAVGDDVDVDTAASICRAGAHEYLVREELGPRSLARAVICAHERALSTRRLLDDAHQDELTGVANRRPLRARFHELRHRALRAGGELACIVIDLDGFKRINDTFGHHVGDEVLTAAAARLLAHVRATDLVARLGGDEFAVLLDCAEKVALGEIVERLERSLAEPLAIDGFLVPVSASVGLGRGAADETTDLGMLLKCADADMYRKKAGRAVTLCSAERQPA